MAAQRCVAAFKQGDYEEAKRLLSEIQQPQNVATKFALIGKRGRESKNVTLVHLAAYHGWLDIIKTMKEYYKRKYTDSEGSTPLHYAGAGGNLAVIDYLITAEPGYDPTIPDSNGALPLHIACRNGHLNATKHFITEQNCDPSCRGQRGWTLLHYASEGGHMNIIRYLIIKIGCDPSIVDQSGQTILHLASYHGHIHVVQWLLHSGKVDIMAKDNHQTTCVDVAGFPTIESRYELLKLFRPFIDAILSFPLHTFSKSVLTGNSGAGKTTLVKVINERARRYFNVFRFGNVEQVVNHTAGIVPSLVDSWEVGKMVLYDLAGHTEYHSSHFAVMETVMQQSPATFINVINLNNPDSEITKQLHYWLNFIDNATCKTCNKSCVIVVGSHADLLTNEQLKNKSAFITDLVQRRLIKHIFLGFVVVDCRKIDTAGTRKFISLLNKSHKVITAKSPSISYYCHLLYAFLKSKPELMSTCTLQEIISTVAYDKDSPLSSETHILTELLVSLSDKGMIIFIQNQQQPEKGWVVVDTEKLLKKINSILFAPTYFKEHRQIASSTGIVLSSSLKQLFPQYNHEMLIDFLQIFELCHRVKLSGNTTNLQSIDNIFTIIRRMLSFLSFTNRLL